MNTTSDPQDRQPNEWYDLSPVYSGPTVITFPSSDQNMKGTATYSCSASGGAEIDFECDDADGDRLLHELSRGNPGPMDPRGKMSPHAISIAHLDGTFTADFKVLCHETAYSTSHPFRARFSAIGSTYRSTVGENAAHFVLPLYNMLSPAFETWPKPQPDSINFHPLRIFPTP